MVRPPFQVNHECNVPAREGYHIVLAVWDVGDTAASFYNVIDLNFGGESAETTSDDSGDAPEETLTQVGVLSGALELGVGDSLTTIVFDEFGERPEFNLSFTADRPLSGGEAAFRLASLINESGDYAAGLLEGGQYIAVVGANPLLAKDPITRIETRVTYALEPDLTLVVEGVPSQLLLGPQNMVDLRFDVTVSDEASVVAELYTQEGELIASTHATMIDSAPFKLHLHDVSPGEVNLVVIARSIATSKVTQFTGSFALLEQAVPPATSDDDVCATVDPSASQYSEFDAGKIYVAGDRVAYQDLVFEAKWWTQGDNPLSTDAFELVSDVTLAYDVSTAYNAGDRVTFDGGLYEAKWWNRGQAPGQGPWRYLSESPACGDGGP